MTQAEILAFSRREAADALGISLRMLDYLLADGKIRGRRLGRRVLIPRAEVEQFLSGSGVGGMMIGSTEP